MKLNESEIEIFAIEELQKLGYCYVPGPTIVPDTENTWVKRIIEHKYHLAADTNEVSARTDFSSVILEDVLKNSILRINKNIPLDARQDAINQIHRLNSTELIVNNQSFHRLLTEGIKVNYQKDGKSRGDFVWLIDYNNPHNNDFIVSNQFTIVENNVNKRPDIIIFINGLPLIVMELKNPADENATVKSAFKQLQTYKSLIPTLFNYNGFLIISDGLQAKAGTISSDFSRFMAWKTADGKTETSHLKGQMETLIKGMLNRKTVLDLIRHFIVFEQTKKESKDTEIITVETEKKFAAYHQYYAVNKAVLKTLESSSENGDRKGGVVWHTQGSGKSLSMVFYAGKIVLLLNNPTILVITDRNDLDDQLFDTFAASKQLIRQVPVQANNREHLKKLLKVASGGIVFTTIQKFQPDEGNVYDQLSDRKNIVVIADEAHRTQYGFKAKTIDEKDETGKITGKRIVYGFAKYMRDALPNATYLGFTGTPIENTDVNTPAVFGNYVDIYDISQAVEDGSIVRIYYESRLAKINLSDEGKKLVEDLDEELKNEDLSDTQKAKAKWTQLEALIGSEQRIKQVANDIVKH